MRRKCPCKLSIKIPFSAAGASRFAMMTKSHSGSSWHRNTSRLRRLSRFLAAARLSTFLEIASPRRELSQVPGRARTVKYRSVERTGLANTRPNSAVLVKRCRRGNREGDCTGLSLAHVSLGGQSCSTLRSPTFQHLPSSLRSHARSEPVVTFAPQVARLKSSFHGKSDTGSGAMEKVSSKTKRCAAPRSGELYARLSGLSIAGP